jgi:hypothetical protein
MTFLIGQFEIKICDRHSQPFTYCSIKPNTEIKYQCIKCAIEEAVEKQIR